MASSETPQHDNNNNNDDADITAAFEAENFQESIERVSRALEETNVHSLFGIRARSYLKQGNHKAALRDARAMTAVAPHNSQGYLLQTKLLRTLQNYTGEIEAYRDGLAAVSPDDADYALLEQGLSDAKKFSKSILNDPKMMELFVLFDKDKKSSVDFKDVAIGLYRLTDNMQDAQRQAAALLLMMDEDDQRTLVYDKFAKLIMAMTAISGVTFEVLYEQLVKALHQKEPVPEEFLNEIRVTQEELNVARDNIQKTVEAKKTLDALSYNRTSKLFEQWDTDHSGTISFEELLVGLRKYQRAVTKDLYHDASSSLSANAALLGDVEKNALMVMGHDKDSNLELDKEEFAYAMADYADLIHVDLHELIDFMCAVASQSANDDVTTEYEAMYSDVTSSMYRSWTLQKQKSYNKGGTTASKIGGLGTIVDMCEEEEE